MTTAETEQGAMKSSKRLGNLTRAQVARGMFKATLPRKPQDRRVSAMEALGETFTLLDRFRGMIVRQELDPDATLHAALAYCLPESGGALAYYTEFLPGPSEIGKFCDRIVALPNPLFLGVVFVQVDPDAGKEGQRTVAFSVPFRSGAEDAGRLLVAQKLFLAGLHNVIGSMKR